MESLNFVHDRLLGDSFLVAYHFLCPMEFEFVVLPSRLFGIAEHDFGAFFYLVEFFVEFRFECLPQRRFEVLWLVLFAEVYADRQDQFSHQNRIRHSQGPISCSNRRRRCSRTLLD